MSAGVLHCWFLPGAKKRVIHTDRQRGGLHTTAKGNAGEGLYDGLVIGACVGVSLGLEGDSVGSCEGVLVVGSVLGASEGDSVGALDGIGVGLHNQSLAAFSPNKEDREKLHSRPLTT